MKRTFIPVVLLACTAFGLAACGTSADFSMSFKGYSTKTEFQSETDGSYYALYLGTAEGINTSETESVSVVPGDFVVKTGEADYTGQKFLAGGQSKQAVIDGRATTVYVPILADSYTVKPLGAYDFVITFDASGPIASTAQMYYKSTLLS